MAIESGSISYWLQQQLSQRGLPIICIDAHKMSKVLSININKTDKNDARLIAEALRCNFFSTVKPKAQEDAEAQILIHSRRTLKNVASQLKNTIRGHLKYDATKFSWLAVSWHKMNMNFFRHIAADTIVGLEEVFNAAFTFYRPGKTHSWTLLL